ncbi:hypothetical protein DIPPA_21769 [Diplonema papillatum]|nr:hypothetical protein DIPPA_21769 [Diplonema papillatum]
MLQTVARSGRAIPKHRSYCKEVASGKTARLLYKMWMKLQEAVDEVRALRRESSTNWANISVLDVLHADPSDILAQNTVLQYLMQPADENLSMMLRVGKHNPMLARTKGDPRMAASDARSARSRSGEVSFKADPDPQVLESSCGTEDASLPSSAGAANRSVRSNSRDSMGSFRSFSSTVRTAATTNVLVDMLKLGVTGNSIVRRQSKAAGPHRLRRKPQQDVHSSDEEEDGATPPSTLSQHNLSMYRRGSNLDEECASPSHRKPNVSSFCASQPGLPSPTPFDMLLQNQRRMEAMLVQIAKEIGVTPRSPESVHDRIEPHIWVSPLQTRSHRSGSLVSSPQAADRLCVLPSNERPVDVGRSVERRPLSPDRLIGRLPSSGLAEAFEGRSPPKSDDRPSNLVVTDVTDNHSSIPCNQSYHSNSNSLNVPDPEKHEKRRMVQLDCPSPPASPLTDTGVSSPRKRPTTGRRDV